MALRKSRVEEWSRMTLSAESCANHAQSLFRIPVIGSIARGDQRLNCSVRGSIERAMEPMTRIRKRLTNHAVREFRMRIGQNTDPLREKNRQCDANSWHRLTHVITAKIRSPKRHIRVFRGILQACHVAGHTRTPKCGIKVVLNTVVVIIGITPPE